jgi:5-methylcytosine-specific restriction endonuclease McrA
MNENTRTCTICKNTKPLARFILDKRKASGYRNQCKDCHNLRSARYSQNNPEKRAESKRQSYQNHKHEIASRSKVYYENNKDALYARSKKWAQANPEKINNKYNRRRSRIANAETFEIRESFLFRLYASACVACGSRNKITMDHVVPISRGGRHSEGNLQPLCLSCNSGKCNKLWIEWKYAK